MTRIDITSHAIKDAGPAFSATNPGTSKMPEPITEPI
ncbi:UNVERIFIED_CONTAM: hypothetical protein ABID98_003002 [Brevibacillus sp. OAP136]